MGQSILSQLLTQRSKMTAFHKSWERWPKHVWQWCVLCLTNTFVCKHACITASAFLSEHLRWADGKKLALILTMGSLCLSLGKLPCACFLVPFTCEAKCIQCKHTYFFGFKKEAMFRGTDERGAVYFCCIGAAHTHTIESLVNSNSFSKEFSLWRKGMGTSFLDPPRHSLWHRRAHACHAFQERFMQMKPVRRRQRESERELSSLLNARGLPGSC